MACLGIKANLGCCRNYACDDSYFCASHKTLGLATLKDRWIRRYFRRLLYNHRSEKAAEHVLAPLRAELFSISRQDLNMLNYRRLAGLDIYLILLREGIAQPEDNPALFTRVILFHLQLASLFAYTHNLFPLNQEVLFNTSQHLLEATLGVILSLSATSTPEVHRVYALHPRTQVVLRDALNTEVAEEWSWTNPMERLEKMMIEDPKPATELVDFMRTTFFPRLRAMYKEQKEIQKARTDYFKEELMMNRWHPDRLMKYLEMGIDIEDI